MNKTEKTLESIGENIGFFTAQSGLRLQQGVRSLRKGFQRSQNGEPTMPEAPEHEEQSTEGAENQTTEGSPGNPTMERAEVWVDRIGEHYHQLTGFASLYVLRATARMREEAEDIWVEAQTLRGGKHATRDDKEKQAATHDDTSTKEETQQPDQ